MTLRVRGLGVVSESLIVLFSFLVAVLVRFRGDPEELFSYRRLVPKAVLCVVVVMLALYYGEMYEYRSRRRTELFLRLGQCMAVASVILAVIFFVVPGLQVGRGIFVLFVLLAWGGLLLGRLALLWTWGNVSGLGDRVLILGTGVSARNVAREMLKRSPVGYRVLGFLTEHAEEVGQVLVNPSVVGTLDDLPRLVSSLGASLIVVAQEDRRKRLPMEALLQCRTAGVRVVEAASLFEVLSGRIPLRDLRPSWLIFSGGFEKPRVLNNLKRLGESWVAGAILLATAPLAVLLALLVRLSGPGPALYRQARVGLDGRTFELLKWRTMRADAESVTGPSWAPAKDDPRITPIGLLLRKSRLDELPQLWNVLRGDMSFVGPRPERPHFVEKLRKVIPYYDERHGVRPGITGWAQVKFPYGATLEDAEEKLEFDLYYVKNMSPLLDVAIVLETFKVMLLGRGR
ncbi:MAG TPA: TIGR03013 family XrtA/PEP-CTERM system glycosyltransferase [Vicinamibacteria bacterium]|nr:TIGR03013 family XrtA/PEP-CTERM system glycosyltransferase [Vicinamibacteria bacterium]